MRSSRLAVTGACLAALAAAPAAQANVPGVSDTRLASHALDGGFPNGPSQDASFSQDRKGGAFVAFDSFASNLVPGDLNNQRDVFIVHRAQPYDWAVNKATDWLPAGVDLVSNGLGGAPANGPSWGPSSDGDQLHKAHCVAFLSAASNLVPGDTNGKVDAFVKNLANGRITRVSVGSQGQQTDGDTYDVQIDGACDRVAFTSDATDLALTSTAPVQAAGKSRPKSKKKGSKTCTKARSAKHGKRRKSRRKAANCAAPKTVDSRAAAVTTAPPFGTKQVYVRILDNSQPDDAGLAGTTFLASASSGGQAGNANSYDVSFGKLGAGCPTDCASTSGDALAFTSDATNLAPGDANGQPDVYERTFRIPTFNYRKRRAGSTPLMKMQTRLVSAAPGGGAGNGPSDQPSINDDGQYVAFRTASTNLLPGDTNGVTDIVHADMSNPLPKLESASRSAYGPVGDGDSSNPSIARPGSPIFYQTLADNLEVPNPDRNCVADVVYWNVVDRHISEESRDSANHVSGDPQFPTLQPCPTPYTSPATSPSTSYYGNWVAFEDANPLMDLRVADAAFPGLRADGPLAARMAAAEPSLHQIYVRFSGP